ncbi:MAG: T9SS type A sorting domain-containing protein, partial [Bacteroidota bacterium]
ELGYDFSINYCPNGSINENCRVDPKPIRWDYRFMPNRLKLYEVTRALIHLKNNYDVFRTDDYDLNVSNSFVKTIHLNSSDLDVTVLGNFNVQASAITPNFQETGTWYEYFTGDSIVVTNVSEPLGFDPGEYRLYTSKRIPLPNDMTTSTFDLGQNEIEFQLFPNPTFGEINISYFLEQTAQVDIAVYNLLGQKIEHVLSQQQNSGRQYLDWTHELANGTYFLRIQINDQIYTHKLISAQ